MWVRKVRKIRKDSRDHCAVRSAERLSSLARMAAAAAGPADDGAAAAPEQVSRKGSMKEQADEQMSRRGTLTEEPEAEIPVANILVNRYNKEKDHEIKQGDINTLPYDPFFYSRRKTRKILNIGSNQVPRVVIDMSHKRTIHYEDLAQYGYLYSPKLDKWHVSDIGADFIYVGNSKLDFELPGTLGVIENESIFTAKKGHYPLFNIDTIDQIPLNEITFIILDNINSKISKLETLPNCIIILNQNTISQFHKQRLDKYIDMVVLGVGTGGTITGVAKRLKEHNPEIQIVGVDPYGSILGGGTEVHSYKVEGIGYDFFPDVLDNNLVDQYIKGKIDVNTDESNRPISDAQISWVNFCLLYTSPSPRD